MKKILLSVSTILMLSTGTIYSQWVRNPTTGLSTGMSFIGGTASTANVGVWGAYTPTYTTSACTVYASEYFGDDAGNIGKPKDSTNQVVFTMAAIANGGDNGGQAQGVAGWNASPTFYIGMNGGATLDLSATANRKLSINIRSTVAYKAELLLLDASYNIVNPGSPAPYINILGDNAYHTYTMTFDTSVLSAAVNNIGTIAFVYNNSTPLTGRLFITEFAIGSAPAVTSAPVINIKKGTTTGITILTETSTTLANTVSGASSNQTFTIENTGSDDLTITNIVLSGTNASEFSLSSPTFPYTIVAGSSQAITVTFAPTSVATGKTTTLTVTNNDASEGSYTINLSADGLATGINIKKGTTTGITILTETNTTIANTASGASTDQTFTIENIGTADLTITDIVLSGTNASEFSLSGPTFPYTIVAGSSQAITVTFAPTSVATGKTATLTVTSNDASEGSYTINLSADGVLATGINAAANISSTKLYPNPTSDQANIQLDLVTPSDVKVTLSDVMGREVMTIAQGSMSSITQSFSVANLQKGIYTVNYFVNGAAAKAQLLMVK